MTTGRTVDRCLRAALLAAALFAAQAAHALSTLSLSPSQAEVAPGDIVTLDVVADFAAYGIVGGSFDVEWDPVALALLQVEAPSVGDPAFFAAPGVQSGRLTDWSIGDFALFTGTVELGTLWFEVLPGIGGSTMVSPLPSPGVNGGFVDFFGEDEPTVYQGATLSRVPLPAGIWLLASGLAMLAGATVRRPLT